MVSASLHWAYFSLLTGSLKPLSINFVAKNQLKPRAYAVGSACSRIAGSATGLCCGDHMQLLFIVFVRLCDDLSSGAAIPAAGLRGALVAARFPNLSPCPLVCFPPVGTFLTQPPQRDAWVRSRCFTDARERWGPIRNLGIEKAWWWFPILSDRLYMLYSR
jgi:hypothetical protein